MYFNLENKKVLLTGSTGSIGTSIAKTLNKSNAKLICTSTSEEKINRIKNDIGTEHSYYKIDLNNNEELEDKMNQITSDHNDIDILINNAGLNQDNLSLRLKDDQWEKVININLSSNFRIIKKVAPIMIKRKYGRILGISSIVAFTGNKGQANYSASKSGMIGLYKSLALEYASRNITVNLIAPGFIKSEMTDKLNEKQIELLSSRIPMNKLGSAEDISYATLFLISEESAFITGQTIHINGGMLMV